MSASHSPIRSGGLVPSLHLAVPQNAIRLWSVALVLACLLVSIAPGQLHAQTISLVPYITTVVGTGAVGCTGNGGPATSAELNLAAEVLDSAGNLLLSGGQCNVTRVVNTQTVPITVAGVTILPGDIAVVAGNGTAGYTGDGGSAISAELNNTDGMARDSAGNLYIVDVGNNVIRKVDTNGIITTYAGNGATCTNPASITNPCGDGGPATSAQFNVPFGIAIDSAGNLYVGDQLDYRVREILTNGTITTVVGNGTPGYSGDGGPATSAQIGQGEAGVRLDGAGNLYLADFSNSTIRKVDTSGIITTIAGTAGASGYSPDGTPATSAYLNNPHSPTIDSAGTLYFIDSGNNIIRKIDASGYLTTVAGNYAAPCSTPTSSCGDGGPAISAQLSFPVTLSIDKGGNFYIGDYTDNRVREVVNGPVPFFNVSIGSSNSEFVRLSINSSSFSTPQLSLSDYSYVLDSCIPWVGVSTMCEWNVTFAPTMPGPRWSSFTVIDGNSLIKYNFGLEGTGMASAVALTPGIISTVAGNGSACSDSTSACGDGGPATSAQLGSPLDKWPALAVTVDGAGNLYIADANNNRIRKVDTNGIITTVAGNGTTCLNSACGDGGPATSAEFIWPSGVALDSAGNLYIADTNSSRIRKVDMNGIISTVAGNGSPGYSGDGGPATSAELNGPWAVAVDGADNLYIADSYNNCIRKVDYNGIITTFAGTGTACSAAPTPCGDGGPATAADLNDPLGVAVDSAGNVYIADSTDSRIRKVDTNGVITTVAGNGSFSFTTFSIPFGIAVDSAGDLYIADGYNNRIRKVDANGVITTVAGNGTGGYNTDNTVATGAELNFPYGAAVDGAGNIYIADTYNNRIRKVNVSTSALAFGSIPIGQTSSPQSIAVSDVGNAILNFTGIAFAGNFQAAGSGCVAGTPVGIGQTCLLGAAFTPTVAGNNLTGTITLTDDAFNGKQTVNLSGSSPLILTVAPTPISVTLGQSSMISVAAGASTPAPTGTITVSDNVPNPLAGDSCSFVLPATSCNLTPSAANPGWTVTASYPGDSNYGSATGTATLIVSPVTTALYLSLSPSSITLGGSSTVSVAVSYPAGVDPPTGTVTVSDGIPGPQSGDTCGFTLTSSSNGQGSCTLTPSAASSGLGWAVTANYSGDGNYNPLSGVAPSGIAPLVVNAPAVVYYTLTVTTAQGTGSGLITDDLEQISCTDTAGTLSGTCSGTYVSGQPVMLTATATANSNFASWGGACTSSGTNQCNLTMSSSQNVTVDFVPVLPPVTVPLNAGSNVTGAAPFCPNDDCTSVNASEVTFLIPVVTTNMSLTVQATEVDPNGLCPQTGTVQSDFDCRFVNFFNYGIDTPTGDTIVPLCYPYANGNCVHYEVYYQTPGTEPPTDWYSGGVYWKIGFNNDQFVPPGPYWTGSTPRLLDNPDVDEFTPPLPYGTDCSTPMLLNVSGVPTETSYYCQFDADITTFVNSAPGLDKTIGGKTQQANDVVVAFLPTTPGTDPVQQPPAQTAPALAGSCINGCGLSGSTITFTEGTGGTFAITSTGYPTPTLTCTQPAPGTQPCTLPSGVTFSAATGLISGTPADGTSGTYSSIVITATNANGSASQTYTLTVNAAPLIMTASSATMTYGAAVPTITASYSGLVNGDTGSSLGTVTCTTTAKSSSPVGTYPSSCTASDSTYSIQSVPGTVTVTAAPLAITANNDSKTYGQTKNYGAGSTAFTASGLLNSDTVTSVTLTSTGAAATAPVAGSPYSIIPSAAVGSGLGNYTIAYANGMLTVSPAPLTITASSATMNYGGPVPTITPIYTGFVNGETASTALTTQPTCSTTATNKSAPGTYTSSCSGAAGPNYMIAYASGTVTVGGLGIAPMNVNFGTLYLGQVGAQFITLTNAGTTPITISSATITSPGNALGDYGNITLCPPLITALPAKLAAGKSCKIAVGILATAKIFSPTASTATLTITDSTAGSPQLVPLTAQVINPLAKLSASSLTFATQKVGTTSAAKSVTLTNTGNTPLTLGTVTISGNFALASGTTCSNGGSVAAGANCVINVTFTPTAKGTRTGSVPITDNALTSPQVISLSGTGS